MNTSLKPTGLTYKKQAKLFRAGKLITDVVCNLRQFAQYVTNQEQGTRSTLTGKSGATKWRGRITTPIKLDLGDGPSFILCFQDGLPDAGVLLCDEKREKKGGWTYSIADV